MARGSSPLTRGKHALSIRVRRALGLIPAHAGKTLPVSPRRSRTRAHPRSHGENMGLPIGYVSTPGSSPLTRGKRASGWHGASCGGLIPAHAGKTDQRGARGSTRAAHPRSRGENGRCSLSFSLLRGSSPLTRGKRGLVVACEVGARLIPAHAGKTPYGTTPHLQSGAHPRSRGENSASALAFSRPHGSSPLTRGKLPRELVDVLSEGLIPAHAGKTRRPRPHPCQDAAHPRSRGENSTEGVSMSAVTGSSPLTRGKLGAVATVIGSIRLIPAHAGKTYCQDCQARFSPAHPRSRGENSYRPRPRFPLVGSSPLTRGKRLVGTDRKFRSGLIPAHAGKTQRRDERRLTAPAHPRSRGENRTASYAPRA